MTTFKPNIDIKQLKDYKKYVILLREKQEEDLAQKDKLEEKDIILLNKLVIKENQLQKLLNDLDVKEFEEPEKGVWNIRKEAEKFRKVQEEIARPENVDEINAIHSSG